METIQVTVIRQQMPVIIEMEDGTKKNFLLKECLGVEYDARLEIMSSDISLESGKVVGLKNFAESRISLLAICLFHEDGQPVPREFIVSLPERALSILHRAAQTLNGLNKVGADEVKNLSKV